MQQHKGINKCSMVFSLEIRDFLGAGMLEPLNCSSDLVFDLEISEELGEARGQGEGLLISKGSFKSSIACL